MGRESRWKQGPNGWELEDPHRETREIMALFMSGDVAGAQALMKKYGDEDRAVLRERSNQRFQEMFLDQSTEEDVHE